MRTWVSAVMPFKFNFKHLRLVFPTSPYQPYGPAMNEVLKLNMTQNIMNFVMSPDLIFHPIHIYVFKQCLHNNALVNVRVVRQSRFTHQ